MSDSEDLCFLDASFASIADKVTFSFFGSDDEDFKLLSNRNSIEEDERRRSIEDDLEKKSSVQGGPAKMSLKVLKTAEKRLKRIEIGLFRPKMT